MFDHVRFGASGFASSKAFFIEALEPIGMAVVSEGVPAYGIELSANGKTHGQRWARLRSQYHANDYAAFVIEPDGHNIEVVCHAAETVEEISAGRQPTLT